MGLLVLVAAVGLMPSASATTSRSAAQSVEYQRAFALGLQAYVYGYPLLDTDRVFLTSTSVKVPDGAGAGPINQFTNVRRLTNPSDKTVVAPNHDTLYSMAWLDLRHQPIVVHMPVVRRRFVVFELVDPYTTNFANIGSVGYRPGNYAVTPPGWHGRLPAGVRRIRSPYTRVWVIGRTYIRNADDTPNVVRIQNEYSLTPLSKWHTGYRPPRLRYVHRVPKQYTIPGTVSGQNPLEFFDALGDQLRQFPPPPRDRPLLRQLATVGIGPGMHPSTNPSLDASTRQGLEAAVGAGPGQVTADLQKLFLSIAPKHNGWLVARTGRYGTDYTDRALTDRVGLGAPLSTLALYPFTITDSDLHPLNWGQPVRRPFPRARSALPCTCLLVDDDVRLIRILHPQQSPHLSGQQPQCAALQRRRIPGHLYPAGSATEPVAASGLAALTRRQSVSADHAAVQADRFARDHQWVELAAADRTAMPGVRGHGRRHGVCGLGHADRASLRLASAS